MNAKKMTAAVLASYLFSSAAFAGWILDTEKSRLNFVSIKKDTIGELHSFKQLNGKISDAGEFEFSVSLSGVETNVPIRNERMTEFLFEVPKFPLASGKGKIDIARLNKLAVGTIDSQVVPVQIDLHGKSVSKNVALQVAKLDANTVWVVTEVPFLIDAAEFDLTAGVDKLRELVLLPNIAHAVPVTASLIFKLDAKKAK